MTTNSIPSMQTAAVLRGPYGNLHSTEETWPVSQPEPGEVLVRIEASGICAGDINPRDGHPPAPEEPIRPLVGGHEGVGYIVALGETDGAVSGFGIGDRVGLGWRRSICGQCNLCRDGMENWCQKQKVNGYDGNGTHQEYVTVPACGLISIPKGTVPASKLAPLMCAGGTALGAVRSACLKPGQWISISGAAGGVGGLAVQYAKHLGYRVAAIDSKDKESHCRKLGADAFINYEDKEHVVQSVIEATQGGANGVVVCSASPASYSEALSYCAVGATIVSVGPAFIQFHTGQLMLKGLKLVAQTNGTKKDIEDALALGNSDITPIIDIVPVSELDKALDRLKSGQVTGRQVISFL